MEVISADDWFQLLLTLLGVVAAFFWRKAKLTEEKRKLFLTGVDIAYNVVNDISKRTPNKVDDKVALALIHLRNQLKLSGGPELSEGLVEQARLLFTAKHGAELTAKEVLAAATPPFEGTPGGLPIPPSLLPK
jgi:hypothetical protein